MRRHFPLVFSIILSLIGQITGAEPTHEIRSKIKDWSPSVSLTLEKPSPTPRAKATGALGKALPRGSDWPSSDATLKLETKGKQSAATKQLNDCKSAASSLFQKRQYEDARREYQKCLENNPGDFGASLGLGYSLYHLRNYDEATKALQKAREISPDDFNANLWLGLSLVRLHKYKEALSCFEKANQIRPNDKFGRRELFFCYLVNAKTEKAARIYPQIVGTLGAVLTLFYFAWFAALTPFSLPIRPTILPGLRFSLAWFGLFFEGQIAFLLLLASVSWLGIRETVLTGVILSALPVIVMAWIGFARQPWGEPFRWPPKFGSARTILIAVMLVILTGAIGSLSAHAYVQLTHKPFPVQHTIPLIKNALQSNVVVAWLSVALLVPIVEEILFRGLLFGAFEKHWGVNGAILGTSVLFVIVHLQIVSSVSLFCIGLTLAWARSRSRSLGLPIALHALNNSMALLALAFSTGQGTS
jgi:membrane protease YdiL (CAAX protease family)